MLSYCSKTILKSHLSIYRITDEGCETLKMTSAQVVETSVIVNNNSSFQNYANSISIGNESLGIFGYNRLFCITPCHFT